MEVDKVEVMVNKEQFNYKITPSFNAKDEGVEESELVGWWTPTSSSLLRDAETRLLSYLKTPFQTYHVNIGPMQIGEGVADCRIWTLSVTESFPERIPLVLVHGLGAAVGLWSLNLKGLGSNRHVHAFDILGFGRSSRPQFSQNAVAAEGELVTSLEEWRKAMGLERFILLGHSMGAFISTCYALKYPERVESLILADPWGFPDLPSDLSEKFPFPLPHILETIDHILKYFYPFDGLRMVGRLGPILTGIVKRRLVNNFYSLGDGAVKAVTDYLYHSNAAMPSGEAAFYWMKGSLAYAKHPIIHRLSTLHPDIPMCLIYGGKSWVEQCTEEALVKVRSNSSLLDVQIIKNATHQVCTDSIEEFNQIVIKACVSADKRADLRVEQD